MTAALSRRFPPAVLLGLGAAVALGLASGHLAPVAVGVLTLAPVASHIRWVGVRRAIAEPSTMTIIVAFYVFIFPLRGLVIAARGYTDVNLARGVITGDDLVAALLLASLATTVLVEAYYWVRGPEPRTLRFAATMADRRGNVIALAGILGLISLGALAGVLIEYSGLAGAQSRLLSHSKEALLAGDRTIAESIWWVLAVPAVWCGALVAIDAANDALLRMGFAALSFLLVVGQIVVFGSRLNAILALIGAWIVCHFSGHPIPIRVILATVPAVIVLSVPIVSERPGGSDAGLPAVERYSRIAGYGVLDASLAVRDEPAEVRSLMRDPKRWFDLPAYFAPSAVWPDKPNIDTRRLDLYVAQNLGDRNQQATGFPTTYVTEGWLYGGWPAVVLMSVLLGALLGWLHRRLVGASAGRIGPAALIAYCFVATTAFSYYKDGDALLSIVGNGRAAVYLAVALLATGVWVPFRRSTLAGAAAAPIPMPALEPPAAAPAGEGPSEGLVDPTPDRPATLLYIMSEHPSVSETFIVNEAAAVRSLGVPVLGYALRRGSARRSAADVDLICPPPNRAQLLAGAIASLPSFLAELWRARGARLESRETARLLLAFAHVSYASARCARGRVAHVHAHFLGRSADVASVLAPRLGCGWTATAHGQDVYAPAEPGLLRRRLRSVAAVACANGGLQRLLLEQLGPGAPRTKVVHCGVDTASLTYSPERAQEPAHLVTVGRLVATKGHWTVLETAATLMRRDPAMRWTIAGDGPLHDELRRDPRTRELAPRLRLAGALDHAATLELVDSATAFVLPCEVGEAGESDGIPVALMEAMALGVPVVTTPIAGIPELVQDRETGFLVSPRDANGLEELLEDILYRTTPEELTRIRAAARRRIEQDFDLVHEARSLVAMLEPHLPLPATARGRRA